MIIDRSTLLALRHNPALTIKQTTTTTSILALAIWLVPSILGSGHYDPVTSIQRIRIQQHAT